MLNNHGTVVQDKKYITFSVSHRTAFRGWMFMDVPYFPVPTDDPLEASRPLLQGSAAHTPPRAGRRGPKAGPREKHWALQRQPHGLGSGGPFLKAVSRRMYLLLKTVLVYSAPWREF